MTFLEYEYVVKNFEKFKGNNSGKSQYKSSDFRQKYSDKRFYDDLCPYCLIGTTEHQFELDHYLPQSQYPDLAINEENLIKVCSTCNRKKADKFGENGERYFLHPKIDGAKIKGVDKFLNCDVNLTSSKVPSFRFDYNLMNKAINDIEEVKIVKKHIEQLDIENRINLESSQLFSRMIDDIERFGSKNSLELVKYEYIINNYKMKDNQNYWKKMYFEAIENIIDDKFISDYICSDKNIIRDFSFESGELVNEYIKK